MLVDHDAIRLQRLVAVPVKLLGKQSFPGSKRVCRIHQNQIICIFIAADILESILIIQSHPFVIKSARRLRQMRSARRYHLLVNLHHINLLDRRIPYQLARRPAIPAANHQHFAYLGMHCHRHMHHHFMIDKFILLCQHHIPVECQKPAKFLGGKNINPLKFRL